MTDKPTEQKPQLSMRLDGESVPIEAAKKQVDIKYQAESLRDKETISLKAVRQTPNSVGSPNYNDASQRQIDVDASKLSGEQMEKAARAMQGLNIKTDNSPSRPNADPIELAQQNQGAAVHNRPQQNPGGPNLPA